MTNAEHEAGTARTPDLDKIAKSALRATDESLAADRAEHQRFIDSIPHTARKKPVEVSVMRWDGTAAGATPIIDWVLIGSGTARFHERTEERDFLSDEVIVHPARIVIDTLEGSMSASVGDWIIRGVAGEFYPCKPNIFEDTYDLLR